MDLGNAVFNRQGLLLRAVVLFVFAVTKLIRVERECPSRACKRDPPASRMAGDDATRCVNRSRRSGFTRTLWSRREDREGCAALEAYGSASGLHPHLPGR